MRVVQERETDLASLAHAVEAASARAESVDTAAEVEVLFKEARARARRRRILTSLMIFTLVVVLGVGAGIGMTLFDSPKLSTNMGQSRSVGGSTSAFPGTYLSYEDPGQSNSRAVGIFVNSAKTGLPIRRLVPGNNYYVGYGFALTPDGKTLYYDEESSASTALRILSVPVAGGTPHVVGVGTTPLTSPDGRTLAYRPDGQTILNDQFKSRAEIALLDITTGKTRLVSIPGVKTGQPLQLSWVNPTELYVVSSDLALGNCFNPKAVCPAKYPGWTALAEVLDTTTGHWATVPLPDPKKYVIEPDFGGPGLINNGFGGYASTGSPRPVLPNTGLAGPSSTPSSVRVMGSGVLSSGPDSVPAIGRMDVNTGVITWTDAVPAGFAIVAGTTWGESYLLSRLSDGQLMKWSPSSAHPPTTVGPPGTAKYLQTQIAW
jgi:hypothetical protein